MKKLLIIILLLISGFCYGQKDSTKLDSMDLKVISMREFNGYLEKINQAAQRQFSVADVNKYQELLKVVQSVYAEADRKRKK